MVGWFLTAPEVPQVEASDTSITVALIAALGTVLVALIGLTAQWISRKGNVVAPPPIDPKLGERVAAAETRVEHSHRTLDMLDRHVDGVDNRVDKLEWRLDDLSARFDTHNRKHHGET